jgi:hypothetical protein
VIPAVVLGDAVVVMMMMAVVVVVVGERRPGASERQGQRCDPGDDPPGCSGQHQKIPSCSGLIAWYGAGPVRDGTLRTSIFVTATAVVVGLRARLFPTPPG